MTEEIKIVENALTELGYTFERQPMDDSAVRFDITVDPAEELGVVGLLYLINGEAGFRLMAYVDELDKAAPLAQLREIMSLNGDIPLGAYCLDPEEDLLYVTVNVPLEEVNADNLAFLVEALLAAQEFYFLEFFEDEDENDSELQVERNLELKLPPEHET